MLFHIAEDKFVMTTRADDPRDKREVFERIKRSQIDPIVFQEMKLPFKMSVGIALGRPGVDTDELLMEADTEMYEDRISEAYTIFDN